jgi:hypothetical protein
LTFENPDDVRMRFMIAAYLLNIDLDEISDSILILDIHIKPEEVLAKIKIIADADPFTLVIIDTFAAFFDGSDTNDATQSGEFMRRLRPLTKIGGLPTVAVAAHPIKNAPEDNLLPYGSGAILNEVDGNLTLWKQPTPDSSTCIGKASYGGLTSNQSRSASRKPAARTYWTSKDGNSCCQRCGQSAAKQPNSATRPKPTLTSHYFGRWSQHRKGRKQNGPR